MKRKALLLLSLVLLLSFSAMGAAAQTNDNIVDIAAKNSNFDTLHTAVVAAGLADTLASADAQYTVFAPTDAAFGDLDPALLSAALADPKGALTTVLTYHVVSGKLDTAELDKEIEEKDLKIKALALLFQQITGIDLLHTLKER